jgi:hypothetical protein
MGLEDVSMTTVLMKKEGFDDILVDSTNVTAHEVLGWRRAKIEISADGQSLIVPKNTYVDIQSGALKLNGVDMVSSAAELNSLDLNENLKQTVHYSITPDAVSAVGVRAAVTLTASAQDVTTAITNPDVPRTVTIKGNVAGITGDVVITGTNILDAEIEDTIALNGTSEVEGAIAFKTVTNIHLPARAHVPVSQVETATVVGTIVDAGDAAVTVTAAGMTGTPKTINVAVAALDTAAQVAGKIRTALGLDAAVIALFTVGGASATVTLTRIAPAANDGTLNISIDNGTCTGLTTAATSANTTAGVTPDTVSVGIAKKFGVPHIVDNASLLQDALFDGSDDAGTLAVDADEVEKNLFSLAGTPNGAKVMDLYYLA